MEYPTIYWGRMAIIKGRHGQISILWNTPQYNGVGWLSSIVGMDRSVYYGIPHNIMGWDACHQWLV
jgi:hypothetical protein